MPIDTSIYGMIQGPKIKSPQEFQAEAMTIRNMGMENQLRQQQINTAQALEQQRRDELERQKRFRDGVGQGLTGNNLREIDPESAFKLEKADAETTKEKRLAEAAAMDARLKELEGSIKQSGYIAQMAKAGTASPFAASTVIHRAVQEKLIDEEHANQLLALPWEQMKQELEVFANAGISAKEQDEMKLKAIADQRAAETHAATLPGVQADSAGKQMTTAERTQNAGLTAKDVADNNRADALLGLQKDQFGETKRHNKQTEGVAYSRLALDKAEKELVAKGMSQESAKVYAVADTMIPELEQLRDAIQKDPRGAISGIIAGTNTHLARLAENAADKVGRLRSGGAVNPAEESRFMGQIARKMDVLKGDPGPAIEAINGLIKEASTVRSNLKGAPNSGAGKVEVWGRDANGKPVRK